VLRAADVKVDLHTVRIELHQDALAGRNGKLDDFALCGRIKKEVVDACYQPTPNKPVDAWPS
jgi:hypothetical protein